MARLSTIGALLFLACGASAAWSRSFEVSPDTTTVIGGVVVDRRQPAEDDGATIVPTAIGPSAPGVTLPNGSNLDAFDRMPNGDVVFSTDITVAVAGLGGSGVAGPADVVMVDGTGPVIVFSAAAAMLPAGTDVDAVGIEPDSDLLLSFDTTVNVSGVVVDDEDVVRIDGQGGAPVVVYDGSAQGVTAGLDLDAVYRSLDDGHLLVSFDGSGVVGGVPFDDEDVLDWNPSGGAYAFAYDGSAAPASWQAGADLDAVSAFPQDTDGDGIGDVADNCPLIVNASQADIGGVGPTSVPDGIGDVCQCGDVNNDGRVTGLDGTLIKRASLNLAPFTTGVGALPAPNKCDVNGGATGDAVFHCSGLDGTLVQRASLVLPPGVLQFCPAADGN